MSALILNAGSAVSWMRAAWVAHLNDAILRAEGNVSPGTGPGAGQGAEGRIGPGPGQPPSGGGGGNRTLMIVLAVIGGLCLFCVCAYIGYVFILGPSVGNVFSGITDNLQP